MRIASKIIANRLKLFLPQVISESQSAFVSGRLISDNILIAHEISHFIKGRRGVGDAFISLKLDMCKAYDRFEWCFLEKMLIKMGFAEGWVEMIMRSVGSVRYVIQVNQQLSEVIHPSRGIRQGDPLSPYLFILGTQGLSRALEKTDGLNRRHGVQISRFSPPLSHLLFANDSLIFIKADREEFTRIKLILGKYEQLSGQKINVEKSQMVCSPNTNERVRGDAKEILGMEFTEKHDKYLGLPMVVGLRKKEAFLEIEERMAKRILNWKSKILSMAGREVLIKAVLTAMPQYAMMSYKMPITLCDKMQKMINAFWWSASERKKPIHWVKASVLAKEKVDGGMGFRNLSLLNDAFLIKQAWRMFTEPELFVSKVFKGRYFSRVGLPEAGIGSRPSHVWRGIFKIKSFLRNGIGYGDGGRVHWNLESTGCFSIKSAYGLMVQMAAAKQDGGEEQGNKSNIRLFWRKIWKANVTERIKIMVWRLFYDALPDAKNLNKRGCGANAKCYGCGLREECALHTVRDCWKARALWSRVGIEERFVSVEAGNAADWLFWCANAMDKGSIRKLMCGVWLLWNSRNDIVHGKEGWSVEEMVSKMESMRFQFDEFLGRKLRTIFPNILSMEKDRNSVCIFCDGSWKAPGGEVGMAAIMMDGEGFKWVEEGIAGNEVEGRELCLGMDLAEQRGIFKAVFISDSLDVVNMIMLGCDRRGRVESWVKDSKELLSKRPEWTIKHSLREGNSLADKVARYSLNNRASWMNPWAIPRALESCFRMCDSLD